MKYYFFIFLLAITFCKREFNASYLNIPLKDWNGNEQSIKNYKGKVVILDFWATWCGPCIKSFPVIEYLREKSNPKNFVFLGINTDTRLSAKQVKNFAKKHGVKYNTLLDPSLKLSNSMGVRGLPGFFVLDRKGRVIYRQYGINSNDITILLNKMEKWEK